MKKSKLGRFVDSAGVAIFEPEPNETALTRQWRLRYTVLERMHLFDAAGLVPRSESRAFRNLYRLVELKEGVARSAMLAERRDLAFRGQR
jgi:hypothetical protein